jgi:hypothetical protein
MIECSAVSTRCLGVGQYLVTSACCYRNTQFQSTMSKQLAVPPKRVLPSKEATLFKDLLALYETRQLKKGLKTADQILKKFPEHGGNV